MRGKIKDQDLTNYALNDGLEPRERLYVESMLGLSEECRSDVYRILDVAQMLEEGFEAESEKVVPMLTSEQRARLVAVPLEEFSVLKFVRGTAAALAAAACVAFALVHSALMHPADSRASRMKEASEFVTNTMTAPDDDDDINSWVNPPMVASEGGESTLIQVKMDTAGLAPVETVCTPPTWQGAAEAMAPAVAPTLAAPAPVPAPVSEVH